MLEITEYSDGGREIKMAAPEGPASVITVERPLSFKLLAIVVLAVAVIFMYRFVVMRGVQYNGYWAFGDRVIRIKTNLMGALVFFDGEKRIGRAEIHRDTLCLTMDKVYELKMSQNTLYGDGLAFKRIV